MGGAFTLQPMDGGLGLLAEAGSAPTSYSVTVQSKQTMCQYLGQWMLM